MKMEPLIRLADYRNRAPAAPTNDNLAARAEALWPGNAHNQAAWIRAVRFLRTTKRGWVMDRKVKRRRRPRN